MDRNNNANNGVMKNLRNTESLKIIIPTLCKQLFIEEKQIWRLA